MLTITKKPCVLFYILLLPLAIVAQQPLNLDFEIKSVEGINRPWGWDLKSWGPVIFKMDSLIVKNGKFSLNAAGENVQDRKTIQSLRFLIEAYELRNRKISVNGSIQTASLEGTASFSLGYTFFDSAAEKFSEVDTVSAIVSGTSAWKTYSTNLNIPAKAQAVYVTVNHSGNGKAWFDDFKLSVGKNVVNEVMVAEPIQKENIEWLNKNTIPVNSLTAADGNKNDDLLSFKNAIGNSRLVALGESTHGTSEFFSLKHRLLQYAVTELGFRLFAIEDNQLVAEKVNRYVLGGEGTAKESMSGMFAVWYTKEVLTMIEWIRHYNEKHSDDKVRFAGFDMQDISRPIDSLFAFLKKQDNELYQKGIVFLADLKANGAKSYAVNDSVKSVWFNNAKEIFDQVNQKSKLWYSKPGDSLYVTDGIQYANLVKQFAENIFRGYWALFRDEAMAENLGWLLEKRYPGVKILIWAHDVHISRCDHPDESQNLNNSISMGSFLSKKYKTSYKSFSLSSYSGEYLALKSYTDFSRVNASLFKGPVGSLDEALHQVATNKKCGAVYLSLPRTETWLCKPLPKRFANHVNIDYGYWERISIPYQFDGVFFIDKTSPSVYLDQ